NEIVAGRITRLADFGAFVELEPGAEGLIPISEMSFERRVRHAGEIVSEGDVVKARVISLDAPNKRISLSIKRMGDDPWVGASVRWAAGSVVEGCVTRTTDFGAFVELTPGVEGLVHVSELSDGFVRSPAEVIREGDTVQAKVLSVDEETRRIALSIKQLTASPEYTGGGTDETEPAKPARKRRKPLKGGLD
ncbi:MAG: S1 RNA-binding domain-containing protein, partial [Planctomycetota bacterium]